MRPTAASPSAAITCPDLSPRPAWRAVVNVRSWRDAKLTTSSARDAVACCGDAGRTGLMRARLPGYHTGSFRAEARRSVSPFGAAAWLGWPGPGCHVRTVTAGPSRGAHVAAARWLRGPHTG